MAGALSEALGDIRARKGTLRQLDGSVCIADAALQPADIILSTTTAAASTVIRADTMSLVSHAALYLGNSQVIEAVESGVVLRSTAEALADDSAAIALRVKDLTAAQATSVIANAQSQLGKKYNVGGAVNAGSRPGSPTLGSGLRQLLLLFSFGVSETAIGLSTNYNGVWCSQLVLDAFWKAGVPIATVPSLSTPQDIVTAYVYSEQLTYVGHLKP